MSSEYAGICGFDDTALDELFSEHMEKIEKRNSIAQGELRAGILKWYDGYSWDGKSRLFNPFSLLNFMREGRFSSYWYQSGAPKFLMDVLKKQPSIYADLENIIIGDFELEKSDLVNLPFIPLLFQTGYLTVAEFIDGKIKKPNSYRLRLPNAEVSWAFNRQIVETLTCTESSRGRHRQK
jgi:hypothetical protein